MSRNVEKEGLKDLKEIKEELTELKDLTGGYPRHFIYGMLYGAGWVIGGIIAIAALGWLLSLVGLIPGLDKLVAFIHHAVDQFNAARR